MSGKCRNRELSRSFSVRKPGHTFNDEYSRLSVLNEGNDIIWWSERTGWGQLYLYDGKGNLKNQITNGYFVTGRVERIDTLGRQVYFEAFGKRGRSTSVLQYEI